MVTLARPEIDWAEQIETGHTLPGFWYTDPAIFEQERRAIFNRAWQYAGHASRVSQPGDYFTTQIAGQTPVIVTRDQNGVLRAFLNICRHRGHQIVQGEGQCKAFQCPYHAWTFGLDGTLRAAPRSDLEPGFDKAEWPLWDLRLESWGPLIFVNADHDAPPLAEVLGEIPSLVERYYGASLEDYVFRARRDYSFQANWKVYVENSIECYHCPVAHPGFSQTYDTDPEIYRLGAYPTFISHIGWSRGSVVSENGQKRVPAEREETPDFQFYYLFPVFRIALWNGGYSVAPWLPVDVNRTDVVHEYYFPAELSDAEVEERVAGGNQTTIEDVGLVESVQRNLRTGLYPYGRFLLNSEHLLQHFDRLVYRAVTEATG
jgi:choline monooxygenase